jgi:rare lipoprotein A
MVIRTKSRNTSIKAPLGLCLFAGAATGALVAMIATTVTTPAVHADAELLRPAVTVAAAPPTAATTPAAAAAAGPTPAFLAPNKPSQQTAWQRSLQLIHGMASWYGGVFNGRKTASGEKYDMNKLTACHPTLPFGSLVRVINRANKRSVVVRINDRGDLVDEGRVIDLSWAAAEKLSMTRSGLAKVDVEVLSRGDGRAAE